MHSFTHHLPDQGALLLQLSNLHIKGCCARMRVYHRLFLKIDVELVCIENRHIILLFSNCLLLKPLDLSGFLVPTDWCPVQTSATEIVLCRRWFIKSCGKLFRCRFRAVLLYWLSRVQPCCRLLHELQFSCTPHQGTGIPCPNTMPLISVSIDTTFTFWHSYHVYIP